MATRGFLNTLSLDLPVEAATAMAAGSMRMPGSNSCSPSAASDPIGTMFTPGSMVLMNLDFLSTKSRVFHHHNRIGAGRRGCSGHDRDGLPRAYLKVRVCSRFYFSNHSKLGRNMG